MVFACERSSGQGGYSPSSIKKFPAHTAQCPVFGTASISLIRLRTRTRRRLPTMVSATQPKRPRRGLRSQPLPIPNANSPCPRRLPPRVRHQPSGRDSSLGPAGLRGSTGRAGSATWRRAAGPILTALWKTMMKGRVRLSSPVRKLLQHPAGTLTRLGTQSVEPDHPGQHQPAGAWFGRFKPRARLARESGTEAGALNLLYLMVQTMGVRRAPAGIATRGRALAGTEATSTRMKQCPCKAT